jgi:hypothetical protein
MPASTGIDSTARAAALTADLSGVSSSKARCPDSEIRRSLFCGRTRERSASGGDGGDAGMQQEAPLQTYCQAPTRGGGFDVPMETPAVHREALVARNRTARAVHRRCTQEGRSRTAPPGHTRRGQVVRSRRDRAANDRRAPAAHSRNRGDPAVHSRRDQHRSRSAGPKETRRHRSAVSGRQPPATPSQAASPRSRRTVSPAPPQSLGHARNPYCAAAD